MDDCQFQCDAIADFATVGLGKAGHNFNYCMIEPLKFSVGNPYASDDTFIRAVIKVQQKREDELDTEEARVIEPWKLHYEQPSSQDVVDITEPLSTFELMDWEREQKKKSMKSDGVGKSKYDPALIRTPWSESLSLNIK